jgi:NDP-sugar pyrophosphorylase family protein
MKSILICPAERLNVSALAENVPLVNMPILGKTLVEYWLEHLVTLGAKEVLILNSDRSQKISAPIGNGERWGLRVTMQNEVFERNIAEARTKFRAADNFYWLPSPNDVIVMDRLPQQPEFPLFTSYANWFVALMDWLPRAATPERIGVRIVKPGVWAGLHTRIAPTVKLHAPCWIGNDVHIGEGAVIGPNVVIEEKTFIEPRVNISSSHIGAETFVGSLVNIEDSIVLGGTLISWKYNSIVKVPDEFLLCSIAHPRGASARALKPSLILLEEPMEEPQPELSWKFNAETEL